MEMLTAALFVFIGFCIMMYVILDGFDLGIGILFPLFPDKHDRNVLMSTILPVWDGNQTWLVLGGASLYGAFPLAFSLILPALYMPIFVMILGLLLRGITFEFRLKATKSLRVWDVIFFLSSTVVTICQGLVVGAFVKGFDFVNGSTTELTYHLFTKFNILCSIALLFGYALLGSTWIIGKTTGAIQKRMYRIAKICLFFTAFFLMIVSLCTPFIDTAVRNIWFNPHYIFKLALLPLVTGGLILYFIYALYQRKEYILFWLTIGIFMCSYSGFGISTYPYLIPRILTVWDAAAPHSSQIFIIVGASLLLPILLGYTMYSYYIFRGKIKDIIGYE